MSMQDSTTERRTPSTEPRSAKPEALAQVGLPAEALPHHVAFIMDGNGRWAKRQGMHRGKGHVEGAKRVRPIMELCSDLGLDAVTFYSFSTENWKREPEEIQILMGLYVDYLVSQKEDLIAWNMRVLHLGERDGLPASVTDALDQVIEATAHCTGLLVGAALNYGSRREIVRAVQRIAREVQRGELTPDAIDDATIANHLDTALMPDPDLLVRTAGEMRVSNYLLWQISYAELVVEQACWPDYDLAHFTQTLHAYAGRTRQFGAIPEHEA